MERVNESFQDVKGGAVLAPFRSYADLFVQRAPRYGVKFPGRTWTTKQKPLADRPIEAHLRGQYSVGVLGKWYPEYCILDVDDRPRSYVDDIRGALGADETNSMLFSSESANSYHLFMRPEFREKPPTIRLLGDAFRDFAAVRGVEVYPQAAHAVRLPFGPVQTPLDLEYSGVVDWKDKLYWFQKLNAFDIATVKGQQFSFEFSLPQRPAVPSIMAEADDLFENGLQSPGSRHDAQFKVIYLLWRRNIPKETASEMALGWIRKKHNGFSKDILEHPGQVQAEIERQVNSVYEKYELAKVYPDSTHNLHGGYITRPDVELVVTLSRGSLPRMRFLFQLVKFCYPRRHRTFLGVHRDRLVEWSSWRTYDAYLRELEAAGFLRRGSAYYAGRFSKSIKLEWPFVSPSAAVLYDGRAVETFEDTVRMLFKPGEFRPRLEAAGIKRRWSFEVVNRIWAAPGLTGEKLNAPA